ncbi:phytase [Myroides pelagicus]|uniref:Phytase n=1 Tax=Myroides pelagicus TaxID=270914 RepID=A0A7K1GHI4_9FLAO|nr:phytase [Myroides pelagicus]MEC4115176.1 phytase [Myroides pelagicus]MTH28451.1 phytase [Myroides pelagicus]
MKFRIYTTIALIALITGCKDKLAPVAADALKPTVVTQQTVHDTDDPAIWINKTDHQNSLILGTDKENGGGIYAFDLNGEIVKKYLDMARPNNIDVVYDFAYQGELIDIAVVTERNAHALRIFRLPELTPIDNGGLLIFEQETQKKYNQPMGVALYTAKEEEGKKVYAITGRKDGPSEGYLHQYEIKTDKQGKLSLQLSRTFGAYSGQKEIEAIAVDNELGYVYYSDETAGVRKYYADPSKGNEELAFFAQKDAKRDHEGIAIYKKDQQTGYIIVSDQQDNSLLIYPREGIDQQPHKHQLIAKIPVSAIECDGLEVTSESLNNQFNKGMLVMMSNGKVFQYYDWKLIEAQIEKNKQ